jgi:hypothetical protein
VSFYSSSPISSLFSRPRHTQKRLPSLALDCSSQRAHIEIFLVMGRGVWDHKSRSYLSTPCLDPRGAPFLLSNNFYNPICGHVCPGRPVAPGQCRGVSQTISQIMASRAAAVAAVCSPQVCVHVRLKVVSSCVRQAIKICEKHKMHSGATLFMW